MSLDPPSRKKKDVFGLAHGPRRGKPEEEVSMRVSDTPVESYVFGLGVLLGPIV